MPANATPNPELVAAYKSDNEPNLPYLTWLQIEIQDLIDLASDEGMRDLSSGQYRYLADLFDEVENVTPNPPLPPFQTFR